MEESENKKACQLIMDARDDGRESVRHKAREVGPAAVERGTHMVEVPSRNGLALRFVWMRIG